MHCVHAPAQQDAGEITTKQATVFQLSTGEVLSPDFTFYSKSLVAVAGLRSAAIGLRRAVVRSNLIQQNHKCPKELSDWGTKNKPANQKKYGRKGTLKEKTTQKTPMLQLSCFSKERSDILNVEYVPPLG